jgi:hypothetical protein
MWDNDDHRTAFFLHAYCVVIEKPRRMRDDLREKAGVAFDRTKSRQVPRHFASSVRTRNRQASFCASAGAIQAGRGAIRLRQARRRRAR